MKYLFLTLFLFFFAYSNSQTIISGQIKDIEQKSIPFANIILKPENSNSITAYCFSDANGNYTFKVTQSGKFNIEFSAMSYKKNTIPVEVTKDTKELTFNATLENDALELKEVVLNYERDIIVKKDTVTFLTKAFLQGNEQVVEDLLKKIPGLTVSNDGTIKVGNQEIEKVMIDNDDLFDKGYKILTKNMPADAIEKVEILQRYSNNKHLKGIEESDKVALNLKLKENYKRQWFGNMQLGHDLLLKNFYSARSNLMNFGKKNKYYFLTNVNNIGFDATGDINHLIRPYRFNEPSSVGDNQNSNTIIGLGLNQPNLKQERVNFNNAKMLSLNSIFTLSAKTKLKLLGFFNTDENDFFRNRKQSYFIGATNFENNEDFTGKTKSVMGFGKIDVTHDINKNKTIEYIVKFNKTNKKSNTNLDFNNQILNENLQDNNELFDQKLVYTNKFKENKVFILTSRYISEKTPQKYNVNQFLFQDLFTTNANNVTQLSENKMQFIGLEAHLLDRKKNDNLLEILIGNQLRKDQLNSLFQLKNNQTVVLEPNLYQNNTRYNSNDLYLKTKFNFKIKKITLESKLDFHQLFNKLEQDNVSINQSPFFINPTLGLNFKVNKKNTLSTSLAYNITNATVLDVYSNYIQTGFRSFSKATGNFNALAATTATLNYTYGNWGNKFFANTFLIYSKNHDFFSSNNLIDQNYSQSDKILIKNREYITLFSNVDRFIKPLTANLKLTLGGSKINFKNSINGGSLREVKNSSINYGLELRSGFKGKFNYHFGSKWSYNQIKTTTTNSFTDNMSFADFTYVFNKTLHFSIQSERYFFDNLDSQNNKYYFLDFNARYSVIDNKITFSLSGNNLFNTKTYREYSISDISISNTQYRLQPRYVMLKAEYRF